MDKRVKAFKKTPFGEMFSMYRTVHDLSLEECAAEMKISVSTLWRIERHGGAMDAATLVKLLSWLFFPPKDLS